MPHQLTEDDAYQGYFMPKDATVMFNAWFVHPPSLPSHSFLTSLCVCARVRLQGYHEE